MLITRQLRVEDMQTKHQPAHKQRQHPSQEIFLALSVKKLFQVLLASQFTVLVCYTCSPTRLFQEVKDQIKGFIITGQDRVAQALWVF